MKRISLILFVLIILFFIDSCGNDHKLTIKGDPALVKRVQAMMDSLGGRENWSKIKSVYVRTLNFTSAGKGNYQLEEWIDLEKPRILNRKQDNSGNDVIQIVDGNDGWMIQNHQMDLLPLQTITNMLNWYDHYFLRTLKILATGGEYCEIKSNGPNRFNVFLSGKFIGGIELNDKSYPEKYFIDPSNDIQSGVQIVNWGKYNGYTYPLEIHALGTMAIYKTDYFDPRDMNPEAAFSISYNPNQILENLK